MVRAPVPCLGVLEAWMVFVRKALCMGLSLTWWLLLQRFDFKFPPGHALGTVLPALFLVCCHCLFVGVASSAFAVVLLGCDSVLQLEVPSELLISAASATTSSSLWEDDPQILLLARVRSVYLS